MDPLSITASATALVSTTGKLVKLLHELHGTIEDAPILLASIIAECTIVHTSLGILKDLYIKKSARQNRAEQVTDAYEIAFTSCALILSVLEKDVQDCLRAEKTPHDKDAIRKFKLIMSKDHLQELVTQLRGQQQALTLLISSLQSLALDEINANVTDNREILGGLARHARRLYIESDQFSVNEQAGSEYDLSVEVDSVISSTRFAFDNEIIASRAYQKTLAYLHRLELRQTEFENEEVEQQHSSDNPRNYSSEDTIQRDDHAVPLRDTQDAEHNATSQTPGQTSFGLDFGPDMIVTLSSIPKIAIEPPLENKNTHAASTVTTSAIANEEPDTVGTSASSITRDSLVAVQDKCGGLLLDQTFNSIWTQGAACADYHPPVRRKAVWVGDTDTGKTCSIIVGFRNVFPLVSVPTVFENYAADTFLDDFQFELELWDTAGFEDYDRLRPLSYKDTHVVVMCYSIPNADSLDNIIEKWISEVEHFLGNVPRILVGCKADLRDDPKEAKFYQLPSVTYAEGLATARKIGAVAYVECSARMGMGTELLFETITKCCVLGDSSEWRDKSTIKKRNSALSLSKMFRRKSQDHVNPQHGLRTTSDPKFSIRIDHSWRKKANSEEL